MLEWNIIDGEFKETTDYINPLLEAGVPARTLISGPMSTGIAEVGRRFKMDEYFLPEVMMSAKCMQAALVIIKPLIIAEKADSVGTCVIGTIQGDLHDIGKNISCLSGLHPHPLGLEWAQTGYRGARHGCSRPRRSPIPAFATRVPATFPR